MATDEPLAADDVRPPETVLMVGDVHGDGWWFETIVDRAEKLGCRRILQVGDFGYWSHLPKGERYLDRCAAALEAADMTCVWIDGNHENHTLLRQRCADGTYPANKAWFKVRDRLFYAPRGSRWCWAGVTFLALGGAFSIDKRHRTEGESWWPEETISEEDMRLAMRGGPVDVLVSHDAPWGAEGVMGLATVGDKDSFPESAQNRHRLRVVVEEVRPKLLVHGHYHHRNTDHLTLTSGWEVQVEGLGRDGDPAAYVVLDLTKVPEREVVA